MPLAANESFDVVLCQQGMQFFPDRPAAAREMRRALAPGGTIAIMGPNFRYCPYEYFDCADHTLIFTHVAIEEHLYTAGFEPIRVVPRYLPYSFRGRLPPSRWIVRGEHLNGLGKELAHQFPICLDLRGNRRRVPHRSRGRPGMDPVIPVS